MLKRGSSGRGSASCVGFGLTLDCRSRRGRTYGELDVLFERKVPARKFKSTVVDQFSREHLDIVEEEVKDNGEENEEKLDFRETVV